MGIKLTQANAADIALNLLVCNHSPVIAHQIAMCACVCFHWRWKQLSSRTTYSVGGSAYDNAD